MRKSKFAIALLLISICLATFLSISLKRNPELTLDVPISNFFAIIFPKQTISFFKIIEIFGEEIGIAIVGIPVILWLFFKKRNYLGILTILIAVVGGNEIGKLVKNFIQRPRPVLEHFSNAEGFSFPSGHAMVGTLFYIVVTYLIIKEIKKNSIKWLVGVIFTCIMFLISVSRVVLQVHYATDVLGGLAFGYILSYLLIAGYEGIAGKRNISNSQKLSKNM